MPQPRSHRGRRLEEQLLRLLADLVRREVKDPRIGLVTVTAVQAAQDLSEAKVFVLPFGGSEAGPEFLEGLTKAAGFLRGEVGRRVGLRHAPRLSFEIDETFDKAARLTALISDAVKRDS